MTSKAARFITQLMAEIAERDARIEQLSLCNDELARKLARAATELATLESQQPSAGVVLPERMPRSSDLHAITQHNAGWNSALDEVARLNPCRAQAVQICKLGMYGQAYDTPGTSRAYTYADQPGNDIAYRLGGCLRAAHCDGGGDFIDFGLALLRRLQDKGFGVFQIAAAQSAKKEG